MKALREAKAQAVIMALYPAQAKKVMEAKAALDWNTVRMVSSGPLSDEQYLRVDGGYSEGTLGFCHFKDPAFDEADGLAEYKELMSRYDPGHPLNRYSLYGFVFAKLAIEGFQRAGQELTTESFVSAMESIREWESGGILPPIDFSSTDHHAQTAGLICELKDDRFQPLTDWLEP